MWLSTMFLKALELLGLLVSISSELSLSMVLLPLLLLDGFTGLTSCSDSSLSLSITLFALDFVVFLRIISLFYELSLKDEVKELYD